jgi:hypothetical protein
MKLLAFLSLISCSLFAGSNSVSGLVLNELGLPVPGATLYLQTGANTQVTVSDLHGNYIFKSVDDGSYKLEAWAQDRVSASSVMELHGGMMKSQDTILSEPISTMPVSLKASPTDKSKGSSKTFNFDIDPSCATLDDTLDDKAVETALSSLSSGEYEIIITKPGSAYVGTCMIFHDGGVQGAHSSVVHTSGMEIAGADFIDAISDQVAIPQTQPCCL